MITEIYYDHDERRISSNEENTLTYEEALNILNKSALTNNGTPKIGINLAMSRLIRNSGDMEAVEKEYKQEERYKRNIENNDLKN